MFTDQEIYKEIGELLLKAAPSTALKIIMRTTINKDGDVGQFEYDMQEENNEVKWFTVNGKTNAALFDSIKKLQDFFISQGQPSWKSMQVIIDVPSEKLGISFDYD